MAYWAYSETTIRQVWAAVTRTPWAGYAELMGATGLSKSAVHAALQCLRDAGYVEFADDTRCARVVRVPFHAAPDDVPALPRRTARGGL